MLFSQLSLLLFSLLLLVERMAEEGQSSFAEAERGLQGRVQGVAVQVGVVHERRTLRPKEIDFRDLSILKNFSTLRMES